MSSKVFFQTQNWRQPKIWIFLLNIPFLSFFKIPASIETVDQWANQNIQFWPVTTKSLAISSHPDSLQRQKSRCSIATWLSTTQDAAINTALAQPHTSQFIMLSYTTSHIFPNWQDNNNNKKQLHEEAGKVMLHWGADFKLITNLVIFWPSEGKTSASCQWQDRGLSRKLYKYYSINVTKRWTVLLPLQRKW